jgi:hypothetical protein
MRNRLLRVLVAFDLALISCRTGPVEVSGVPTAGVELAIAQVVHEKGDLRTALQHAQKAVFLSPEMTKTHYILGKITDDMCIPNAEPVPDDERLCGLAIQEYKKVLELDTSRTCYTSSLEWMNPKTIIGSTLRCTSMIPRYWARWAPLITTAVSAMW